MAGFLENLFDPNVLYKVLEEHGRLPDWAMTLPYGGANGEYYPQTNRIVANYPNRNSIKNTVSHEMTHAVQGQLLKPMASDIAEKKWNKQPVSAEEEQYLRAAQTMFNRQFGRIGQYDRVQADKDKSSLEKLVNGLFSGEKGSKLFHAYRTAPGELQAFGAGNMSSKSMKDGDSTGNHLDATLATEFSILLDLYNRISKQARDASANSVREKVDYNRKLPAGQDLDGYDFIPPKHYKNPFQ